MVHASYWSKGISIRKADQHVAPPPLVQYTPLRNGSLTPPSDGSLAPPPITMQWTRNTEQVMQQTYHSP